MKRLVFVMLLAVALVVGSAANLPGREVRKAEAEDRCGTIWAGEFYNDTSRNITVKGDSGGGVVVSRVVYPGESAMDRGVCDADHIKVPSSAPRLLVVYGTAVITFYTGQWAKIGANTFTCYDTGGNDILCYT